MRSAKPIRRARQTRSVTDAVTDAQLARSLTAETETKPAWTGGGSDDLRKSASDLGARIGQEVAERLRASLAAGDRERRERAEGAALGKAAGERLVAAAEACRKRAAVTAGQRVAAHAIVDAFDRRDHLRALAKATPGYVPSARLVDSEQAAEALAAPVSRAAFVPAPTPAPPAEHHDDELAAAAAAGDVNWLDRLNTEAVAKAFARDRRRLPVGAGPRAGA